MTHGEMPQTGRSVIESIRRDEYMIGLEMEPIVQAAAGRLRQQLGKALELLAADLYASETHFLLELIQNADDNTYVQGVVPTIRISLKTGELVFFNNETGFLERNVRALCGVGKSTKAKDKKSGFIGEKGIGFKSVFQVSDTPEIHSNGFHFFFDMSKPDDLLGYVVPNWKSPAFEIEASGTTIVLPAKHGRLFTNDLLKQLHPKLMLFLRRLRRMEFETDVGRQVYERRDSKNIVTVLTGVLAKSEPEARKSAEQYLRFASPISMVDASDEKRDGIASSELVLAFPLDSSGRALAQPGKEVFAFLPIRNFGFRFYIQGDFLLSSSREDILESREWNRHLRDSIAPVFVKAIEEFKESPTVVAGYLNYLPEADEITHEFFKPVLGQLISVLAETECVPGATGVWRKPADVMITPPGFSDLVSPEESLTLFGRDYPSPDLTVSAATLRRIGCASLMVSDIIAMFSEHTDWLQQRGIDWIIKFYRFVGGLERKPLLDGGLAKAPVVLIENATLQTAENKSIFYPLVPGKKFGFEHELTICHEALAKVIDEDGGELRSLLNDVGVRLADPYELIIGHILPLHKNDEWKKSETPSLIGHLRYVKEMWRQYLDGAKTHGANAETALKALQNGIRVGTKNRGSGWTFWVASQMYLSSEFDPDFDIEAILGEKILRSRLVSPLYLAGIEEKSVQPEELASWKDFLFTLGVNRSPRIEYSGLNDAKCSEEFESLLSSADAAVRRLTLECLDRNWSRYPSATHFTPKGRSPSTRQQYSFVTRLRATIAPSKKRRQVSLDASFHDSSKLRESFGDSPNYVDAHLANESFLSACGIRFQPDVDTCVARLKQLREAGHTGFPEVQRIYRLLERLYLESSSTIKQAFRDDDLILTRATTAPWRRASQVVWGQQGPFLGALYPSLQGHYSEYQSFFRKIGVPSELPVAALIRALPKFDTVELAQEERSAEVMRIYGRANRDIVSSNGDGSKPVWLDEFKAGRSFLSTTDKMVSNDGCLFLDDKPAIAELFRNRPGIDFVAIPSMRLPQVQALMVAANVPLLSSEVSLQLESPGRGAANVELSRRVHERFDLIARLVYSNSHAAFRRAVEGGKWKVLAELVVEDVDNLVLRVELGEETASMMGDVIIEGTTAYVRKGVKGVVDRLAVEVCALLAVSPTFADGISRILSESEIAGAEEFLEVKGVTELPDDERQMLLSGDASSDRSGDVQSTEVERTDENSGKAQGERKTSNGTESLPTSGVRQASSERGAGSVGANAVQSGKASGEHNSVQGDNTDLARPGGSSSTTATSGGAASPPLLGREGYSAHRPMRFSSIKPGQALQLTRRRLAAAGARIRNEEGTRRLISYVEPVNDTGSPDSSDPEAVEARLLVERAAVKFFIDTQAANWSSLEEMPSHNTGFDIKGISLDGQQYYIEVKGQSGAWTAAGVSMTPPEMLCAAEHRECFWLCVVEYVLDQNRRSLHIVRNPFGDAGQFRFDAGWKGVAVSERSAALVPAAGLRIKIDDVGSGEIVCVLKSGGIFSKVQVRLDSGSEVTRVFNPAKMQLSKAK
ncbi:DUF3883 domain-containing protein [Paraburkholderia tropica]|uniref:DUF3883 domain-containing protein n=1 Tax=Paraburkholderia tropica TaxID=92647 RepID=UPI002ABD71AF|nr:DUF3883 domain-containing protein [Paraburkholderia tropica]